MKNSPLILKITKTFSALFEWLNKYKLILFGLFVTGVYGYLLITISLLSSVQPTAEQIGEQSRPIRSAKVDEKIISQLQQLQDNSVSVKALFDEARDNPFQEN